MHIPTVWRLHTTSVCETLMNPLVCSEECMRVQGLFRLNLLHSREVCHTEHSSHHMGEGKYDYLYVSLILPSLRWNALNIYICLHFCIRSSL